jgi:hypothetical protein
VAVEQVGVLPVEVDDLLADRRPPVLEAPGPGPLEVEEDDRVPLEVGPVGVACQIERSRKRGERSSPRFSKKARSIDRLTVLPKRRGRGSRATWTPGWSRSSRTREVLST